MISVLQVMKMIESQAKKMSSFFISNGVIDERDREKFDYCYEVMLSTLLNVLAIVLIGAVTGFLPQTVYFLAAFVLLKNTVGGYHACSHLGCFLCTLGTYLAFRLLGAFLPADVLPMLSVLLASFAAVTVFLLAPVGTENKPLGRKQAIRLKRDSRLLVFFIVLFILFLLAGRAEADLPFSVSFGIAAVAASLIAGKIRLDKSAAAGPQPDQTV